MWPAGVEDLWVEGHPWAPPPDGKVRGVINLREFHQRAVLGDVLVFREGSYQSKG